MQKKYTFERVDTATRVRREELEAQAPGWGGIDKNRPQFAIFAPDGRLADWPLINSFEEAVKDCREFNTMDDGSAASEALWQGRMGGDMSR
jgi:hypothetical protein